MAIRRMLQHDHAFSPEEVAALTTAFESCLGKLKLKNRDDPATIAVAKVIIELAKAGERDLERLCDLAIKQISE
jgi:hypothetical protein